MIMPVEFAAPNRFYSVGSYDFLKRNGIAENQKPEIKQQLLDVISLSASALRIIDQHERIEDP